MIFAILMTIVSAVLVAAPVTVKIFNCIYSTEKSDIDKGMKHVRNYAIALSILVGGLPIYFVLKPWARQQKRIMDGYQWICEEIQPLFGVVPENSDLEEKLVKASSGASVSSSLTSFRDEKLM